MLIKGNFCSSKGNLLKYFGRDYRYKSKAMTQKENTASNKYQRPNLVLEDDSPGIPINFASSLQHLWNNTLSLYRCFFCMKCFICSRYYSCVLSLTGMVWFFSLSQFKISIPGLYPKWRSQLRVPCLCLCAGAGRSSVGWEFSLLMDIVPQWYRHNIAMQWRFSDRELVFKVLSDVCLWWCLTQSCTALPGEPRVAGDQILFRISQDYDFLDGTVSTRVQRTSAESRKSLSLYIYI